MCWLCLVCGLDWCVLGDVVIVGLVCFGVVLLDIMMLIG